MNWRSISRRLLIASAALLLSVTARQALGQTCTSNCTATGTLAVTATVENSFSLTFATDSGSGVTLSGSGTNAATVPFGTVYDGMSSTSTITVNTSPSGGFCTSCFSVATNVNLSVSAADAASTSYTLQAELASSDSYYWQVNSTTINHSTETAITLSPAGSFTSPSTLSIALGIPTTMPASQPNNTIDFLATAN
jgi:hypothetical protein